MLDAVAAEEIAEPVVAPGSAPPVRPPFIPPPEDDPGRTVRWVYDEAKAGREVEVIRLAAKGLSNKAIADRLVVSPRTVQHHLAHVYDKTGCRSRAGLTLFAVEHGLIGPGVNWGR